MRRPYSSNIDDNLIIVIKKASPFLIVFQYRHEKTDQMAFAATVPGESASSNLWSDGGGVLNLVARNTGVGDLPALTGPVVKLV
jgi:hypothetical protein